MTALDKIKSFLSDATDISLGYSEINFIQPDNLDEEQIGYSVDTNGNSLITSYDGDWQEQWLVIASDQLGDPIFIDVSSPDLPIVTATHGEGTWEPLMIADSLQDFKMILVILNDVSSNRSNPVDIEKNPLNKKDRRTALSKIKTQNRHTDISYWENFFKNA